MKHLLLFAALLVATIFRAQAQHPTVTWNPVVALGQRTGDSAVYVTKTVPDGKGNLYVAGYFFGKVRLNGIVLESTRSPTTSNYTGDIFVGKYSLGTGRYTWAVGTSGTGGEGATQLVVSGSNLYLAGEASAPSFTSTTLTIAGTTFPVTEHSDMFVAKLVDRGSSAVWQWGKVGNTDYLGNVVGLSVSGTGVYLFGDLSGTIKFDNKSIKTNQSLAYNAGDLLLVKFTDAGTSASVAWGQVTNTSTYEFADAFVANGKDLYVAGSYFNTTTIGSTTLPNSTKDTQRDAFVVKYTDTGTGATPVWVQHVGGSGDDRVNGLTFTSGTLYAAGQFSSRTLAVGGSLSVAKTDTARYNYAPFVARLTDAGSTSSFQWATAVPLVGTVTVGQLAQAGGALYVSGGFFGGNATFGSTTLIHSNPTTNNADLYLLRLDEAAGGRATLAWAGQLGSTSYDFLYSLFVLNDRAYVQAYNTDATTIGTTAVAARSSYLATANPVAALPTRAGTAAVALGVYPNPVAGTSIVSYRVPTTGATVRVELLDLLGRTMRVLDSGSKAGGEQTTPLEAGREAAGTYLVRVQVGDDVATSRVVLR